MFQIFTKPQGVILPSLNMMLFFCAGAFWKVQNQHRGTLLPLYTKLSTRHYVCAVTEVQATGFLHTRHSLNSLQPLGPHGPTIPVCSLLWLFSNWSLKQRVFPGSDSGLVVPWPQKRSWHWLKWKLWRRQKFTVFDASAFCCVSSFVKT